MKALSTRTIGVTSTLAILTVTYIARPEYFTLKHFLFSAILVGAGFSMILSYVRKEEMYLYTYTLKVGEDDGLRFFGLIFGIFCILLIVVGTFGGQF
jgi:hypothetical protein